MINLMPPETKEQIAYSKKNVIILRYSISLIVITILVAATFMAGSIYASSQISKTEELIQSHETKIQQLSGIESDAIELSKKVKAIESLFGIQTRFSRLLDDIAKVMPSGASLSSLTLTGDDTAPLTVQATVKDKVQAGVLRNALLESERFSAADIQNVTEGEGSISVQIVLAFTPGAAR